MVHSCRMDQITRSTVLVLALFFIVALIRTNLQKRYTLQDFHLILHHDEQPEVRIVCEDTCKSAGNGVCEDGSDAAESETKVSCDLGTDCSDCGPWGTEAQTQETLPRSNVKALVDQTVDMFVRSTATEPTFLMPYTDFRLDNDVSGQMHHFRIVEGGLTWLWKEPLERCCAADPTRPGLVLDVGGNFGWYALYAAKMGCRVVTWEPVPHYREFLEYGVSANNLTHLIHVRGNVVGLRSGEGYVMQAPEKGNWGLASINGHNLLPGERDKVDKISVPGERIDDVVAEDVCVLKVDVEGFEADVFDSAKELFKNHVVHNVFMEYTPGAWETDNVTELFRLSRILSDFLDGGYNIRHVPDRISKRPSGGNDILPLIRKENIEHDVQDLRDFQNHKLGCSKLPEELQEKYSKLGFCQRFPFSAHPKSFRSEYFFNTNIWAIRKEEDSLPQDSVVGVLKPDEPLAQYFSSTGVGIGGRICSRVPPKDQLLSRCPCTNQTVCGGEQELLFAGSATSWGVAAFSDQR